MTRPGAARSGRRAEIAVVTLPTLLAGALTFYGLPGRSLWIDEAATATIAAQHGAALGAAMARDGGNMLAYYGLLHVLIGLFGNGTIVLRLPSALATAGTVALVSVIARRLFDRRVALCSGVLSAVSLPLVYWGQDARAYAPMAALVAASFLAFIALVDPDRGGRGSRAAWTVYVVVTTAALYTSLVAVLVVPAQLVALARRRGRLRPVLSAVAVVAACCVPLAVLAEQRGSGQLFWVPKPSLTGLGQVAGALTSATFQPNFPVTATSNVLLALSLAVLAGAGVMMARGLARRGDERAAFSHLLLLSWLVVPVVLAWLESSVGQSIFLARNLLVSLPPVGIVLAWAIAGPHVPRSAGWSALSWSGLAALVALRSLQLAPSYGVSPENWRAAAQYVLARAEPRDCIAFYPSDGRMAFEYYLGTRTAAARRPPRSILPVLPWGVVRPYVEQYVTLPRPELAHVAARCPRLWFVASHQGQWNGPPVSRVHYTRYLALGAALAGQYADHRTVAFGYAAPVEVELLSG